MSRTLDKIRLNEVLNLFKDTFKLIGIESLRSGIEAYENKEIDLEELLDVVLGWNSNFNLVEFLDLYKQKLRNQALKLGDNYYSIQGIVSIGKQTIYSSKECKNKYQIILNPVSSTEVKLLYTNIVIEEFDLEVERDQEFNFLIDKLNLLGIRHLK